MATPITTGAILSCTTWCQLGPQASLNISGWRATVGAGVPTYEALANALYTPLTFLYAPLMTNSANFLGLILKQLTFGVSPPVLSTNGPNAGSAGDDPESAQTSAIFTLLSAQGGRRGRGRKYIGFLDKSLTGGGFQMGALAFTSLGILANYYATPHAFTLGAASVSLAPVILNRAAYAGSLDIVGSRTRSNLATQRRRGAYGRPNVPPF